uniref:Uncharacterized protein n=1 Tax=Sphaerodactylus townsendi TaxID=933632 RepID=A0ACB8FSL2_9SAUR
MTSRSEEQEDGKASFERVRYIFLNFDAWEYVGCDHIWAGIVTTLLDEIEEKNKILFSVVRAFGGEPEPSTEGKRNKLQNDMKRKDLSVQLGFMNSVKEEVKTTINFLRFKALKEDREIRAVLKITNLDRCSPDKVVAVLDAINILLCDRNAPFISILAADPSILVEAIQWSSNTCNNGYLYLDRIVSLPFSLPRLDCKAKMQLLETILGKQLKEYPTKHSDNEYCAKSDKKNKGRVLTKEEIRRISSYLQKKVCDVYLPGNSVQMKRVVNTVLTTLTMIKMGFQPKGGHEMNGKDERESIEQIIDWIVLANCWPCRLSWILQCVEDEEQRKIFQESSRRTFRDSRESTEVNQWGEISEKDHRGLLQIYEANAWELDKIKYNIRKLLELDGDPDLFRSFLEKDHFTVGRASYFSDLLLNLDFSLQRQFELLRGLHSIPRGGRTSDGSPPAEEH